MRPTAVKVAPCMAVGCRTLISIDSIFCGRCDALLQSDIKAILGKHFRPRKPQSKLFHLTLARAREEILYAKTVGHKMPQEGDFEW